MSTGEQVRAPGPGARKLAAAELGVAVAVLALVPRDAAGIPEVWPLAALLVLGSVGLWLRGATWSDVGLGGAQRSGWHGPLGLALGALAALAAGFVVGPGLAAITGRALDAGVPAAPGDASALVLALPVAWAHAFGSEMVFRGWLLARIESVWPAGPSLDHDAGRDDGTAGASTGDASTADAGTADAGTADAGIGDAGTADAGTADAAGSASAGPLVLAGLAYGWYLGDGSAASFASAALVGVGLCFLRRAGQGLIMPIAAHGAYASVQLALVYAGVSGGAG